MIGEKGFLRRGVERLKEHTEFVLWGGEVQDFFYWVCRIEKKREKHQENVKNRKGKSQESIRRKETNKEESSSLRILTRTTTAKECGHFPHQARLLVTYEPLVSPKKRKKEPYILGTPREIHGHSN